MIELEIIGYVGGILFAVCGAPQAWQSIKQGHSRGINSWFLFMWGSGEALMLTYSLYKFGVNWPLIINYGTNLAFIGVIAWYKLEV